MTTLSDFKALIRRGDYLVLDTETTGLSDGEIVQIAIADDTGAVLLDTLVRPVFGIPDDARRIHGISDTDVATAPRWTEVAPRVQSILIGRDVVIYNAVYDRKMMHQSSEKSGIAKIEWKEISRFWCAMEAFAEEFGDYNSYRGSYRWQKLTTAASHYGIPALDAHSALGDVMMTLAVCKAMAGGS